MRRYQKIRSQAIAKNFSLPQNQRAIVPAPPASLPPYQPVSPPCRLVTPPESFQTRQPRGKSPARTPLFLAMLLVLGTGLMTVVACALVGLLALTLPATEQKSTVIRRPAAIVRRLPTLAPMPVIAQPAAAVPTPTVENVSVPTSAAPSVISTPVSVSANVDAIPPSPPASQPMPQTVTQAVPLPAPPLTPPQISDPSVSTASGWTFSGVTQLAGLADEGVLLMGELVNGTGAPQQAVDISGAFYDAQGQLAAGDLQLVSYVPVDPVPVDAHVPFELQVNGSDGIDRFDLNAVSQPASVAPRQDFQFSNVEEWVDDMTGYCLKGQVDNLGPPVQDYLIVLAVGYDDQGSVVNFGEYYVDTLPQSGSGAPGSPFEVCLALGGQQISRHDLIAFAE